MELSINNEITNKKEDGVEINDFINELTSTLEKKKEINTNSNLYNEILEDVELAPKYQDRIQSIINKCLKDMSYERDFLYFDYDRRRKEYCLKYYWNGDNTICDKLTKEDIGRFKKKGITFYEPVDDKDTIGESDSLKDWIKCEVQSKLLDLDMENRNSKGK
jgi:hypothetical protein